MRYHGDSPQLFQFDRLGDQLLFKSPRVEAVDVADVMIDGAVIQPTLPLLGDIAVKLAALVVFQAWIAIGLLPAFQTVAIGVDGSRAVPSLAVG